MSKARLARAIEILLVDDSPSDRLMAIEALAEARVLNSLHVVENGEECMAFLRKEGRYRDAPRPDLVLLDLNMPRKDGREVLAEMKGDDRLKHIPVIVLTTSAAEEDVVRAYANHANSYIVKPVNFHQFSDAVKLLGTYWMEIVTLPTDTPASSHLPATPERTDMLTDRVRVLLLEDNPVDALLTRNALDGSSHIQFEVSLATRLSEYRELLRTGAFDVIITDLGLPDSQGLSTYRQVKASAGGLPIIVLTGDENESVGVLALREGAQEYLVKGQMSQVGIARAIRYAVDRSRIEDQLRRSQRLEAIGRVAGGVAHDFNNLLTVIDGHADLLAEEGITDEERQESLVEIRAASRKAASLTQQLLTFSRRQVVHTTSLDLNGLLDNFAKMLRRLLREDIALVTRTDPAAPVIEGDPGMIEQVLMNLAVNARDAMPGGGTMAIELSSLERSVDTPSRNVEAYAGKFVLLSVSDTGTGIPAEVMPRIFDPFFTTKEVGKGTGLGLAIVHSIVSQHRGWIEVYTDSNGTTFHVYLPIVAQAGGSESEPASEPPAAAPPSQREATILLVEDEPALRLMACRRLRRESFTVLEAANGQEALELFASHRNEIDLLFTDIVMPGGLNGLQLATEVLAEKPELSVVFTSGYSEELQDIGRPLVTGKNFLPKPYTLTALLHQIRGCLPAPKEA